MTELRAIITGRVQFVMMRDFVQRKARGLGLTGYVQNMSDGSVEVVAHGERQKLEQLVLKLHKGPLLSRVDAVRQEWSESQQKFDGFVIVY